MGRAAACGGATWFAVLRDFELVGKNCWGVSFAYRLRRLAWLASRWQLRFRPIGVGGS
jgi:hypothetical protein